MKDTLQSFIEANHPRYVDELTEFLKIPSISALPAHSADVRQCAHWTATALERAGLRNARLIETHGNPVVYAEWLDAPAKPTVLCYGHYDVQPADPVSLWQSPPFAPTVRDGKLYARGASDDKGQIFMHFKAIEAHLRRTGRLPVNVRVMVEGEEETAGDSVDQFVRDNKDMLAADVVVISDGAMFDRGVPSICYGLRGIVYFEIEARGPAFDLHSGSCGGAVANPAIELARILAQLVDLDGRIAVPGFYDSVRGISSEERAAIARLPFSERDYLARLDAPRLHGEPEYSLLERLWFRPTCDVNGLVSGFTEVGTKTIIPSTATAKVSMRLVPDQEPEQIANLVEAYVRDIAPPTVDVQFRRMPGGGRPWTTAQSHRFMNAAVRALEKGFGLAPVFTREGGSNPLINTFEHALKVPIVRLDLGLPDDDPHAPNEKLDLRQLLDGIVAAAHFYEALAEVEWTAWDSSLTVLPFGVGNTAVSQYAELGARIIGKGDVMSISTNTEVVERALRIVFSEHRLDEIDHFFSPDFVQHSPYASPGGRDQLRQWWAGIVDAIPNVTTTVEQAVAADDRVAVFRVVRGTIRKDLDAFGIKGNGQEVTFRVADIFTLRRGQITAHWEVADTGPLMQLAAQGMR